MDALAHTLQLPAWIVALGIAFFLGAKAVMMVKGGNGNGTLAPEIRTALQAVTITLTALTERLSNLPTREEIKDVAQGNRHAFRNDLQATQGAIVETVERAEQNITRLIPRTAA